jgi:3-oxoacyl-[acyl-carrier-protein] synthase II
MERRIVITGAGCVTPLGASPGELWNALTEGRSGVGPLTLFDASGFPVRIAAEVRNWDLSDVCDRQTVWGRHARQTKFAVGSALTAARSSGVLEAVTDPQRIGVFTGCGEIYPDFQQFCRWTAAAASGEQFDLGGFLEAVQVSCSPDAQSILEPGSAVGLIAGLLDVRGPNINYTAACVSSSKAICDAADTIRCGDADVMLAGGAHSMIHPFGLTGFHRLSTLSTRNGSPSEAARPFDRERDGFVVGEGGTILVLEELQHALRRGAEIWGELRGWATTHDAYRITDLEPEGRAAARCVGLALQQAALNPEDIDYINAHGSGTVVNDKTETLAIKRALGNWAYHVPISSTKSMTGHLTTACGAIEALICLMVLRHGVAPPTINYTTPDPECDLDYVPNTARPILCKHSMNNSFGFGGQNVVLIFSRFER